MPKPKRAAYEYVIIFIVIALTVTLGAAIYAGRAKVRRGNLLIRELGMMRSSITLYKLINRANPESLEELGSSTYEVDSTPRFYIDSIPRDSDGDIVDPFGTPYNYKQQTAWVWSGTPGYENW